MAEYMRMTREEKKINKAQRKAEADVYRGFRLLIRMAKHPENEAFRRVIEDMKKQN